MNSEFAISKSVRAYIIADMVGACGIWRRKQFQVGTYEWRQARRSLTMDINSAIEGLQRVGYRDIIIKDIHGSGTNIFPRMLLPRVRYESGFHMAPVPLLGKMHWAHCAVLLGFHARAGSEEAFFASTFQENIEDVRVNGLSVGEAELVAAILGELGIPVPFISGDAATISQVKARIPWCETLVVPKSRESSMGAKDNTSQLIRKRNEIRAVIEKACTMKSALKKFEFSGPVHFEVAFRNVRDANFHNSWGLKQTDNWISWESDSFITGFRQFLRLLYVPRPLAGVANYLFGLTNFLNRTLHGV